MTVTVEANPIGLSSGAMRMFFVDGTKNLGQGFAGRHRMKWRMAVDLSRQKIVAQMGRRDPYNDCKRLRPPVDTASRRIAIGLVLASDWTRYIIGASPTWNHRKCH
jgi:hypothetical protein